MARSKGHDPGHAPPAHATWQQYVELLVHELGGWSALADALLARVKGPPQDRGSVEKGLRRLAARGQKPGGDYGRWLVRAFGVPTSLDRWSRWMGQYHSRFSDLPVPQREAQLQAWDRPPLSETPSAAWIQLGLAAVALQRGDELAARAHRAEVTKASPPAAQLEAALLDARLGATLEEAARLLTEAELSPEDRVGYAARLADQQAYKLAHQDRPQLAAALKVYESIDPASPFAAFRLHHGAAYCLWKLGRRAAAKKRARLALQAAGDGGFIRFRVQALSLLARLVDAAEARQLRRRARHMSEALSSSSVTFVGTPSTFNR